MIYLISPKEEIGLRIEAIQLAENLKNYWSNINIRTFDNPERVNLLEWEILMHNHILEGRLPQDGKSVNLDGYVEDCAKFALWLRSQIDDKYQLFFYDQAYSADVELRRDTTEEKIIKHFIS